ncbi:hypothetical protein QBC37DRAFT_208131 [Rhypophila decipiens]|uniref:Uncharacterized protein n=1 Tax=Rhypophila decipiens TaxID=261697 RepID=A0AAN7B3S4_9PEZI|nr:hypothetical protein QBC37DRAFT_208131 [Rhypophila decipiens]
MPCFTLESHAKLSILTYLMDEPVVRAFFIFAVLSSPPVWAFYWLTTNDCGVAWHSITSRYGIVWAFTFGTHSFLRSFLHGGCEYLRRSRRTARHFLSFWVFFFFVSFCCMDWQRSQRRRYPALFGLGRWRFLRGP